MGEFWPWIVWLVIIATSFAVLEAYAFMHPTRLWTLSRFIAWMGRWPMTGVILGIGVGSLLTHFFWHFCPTF